MKLPTSQEKALRWIAAQRDGASLHKFADGMGGILLGSALNRLVRLESRGVIREDYDRDVWVATELGLDYLKGKRD